ncbi:SPJ_0845 family protein [Melissococcus plutonius]|uniref:Uncharacterized protein n=1 Tax=Melissococcus plutonius TaxID=33970 RepID=A0A2Z5Y342_9ENTE|nr:SPJ_0845 family protein [Melissococcus plutonius]BAL62270.1 hypothetical protein MPD5_1045 [Melissococcus plutonius DAT561]MCV2498043.1 hypothetical protein [Melissococcus plutonius]MCV2500858.1 hypothetical protein [Melissococcus plutonius]MCV2504404.1 hypothetical protein [Melissococcus plutonius]MCV2506658.1 hypothetical protein [Melissococcus plutonius]
MGLKFERSDSLEKLFDSLAVLPEESKAEKEKEKNKKNQKEKKETETK